MTTYKPSPKRCRNRERRRRRLKRDLEEYTEEFTLLQLYMVIIQAVLLCFFNRFAGKVDLHRERKCLKKDIFDVIGPYYLPRAYRMCQVSFYDLHSIFKDDLEEFFLPSKSRYNNYQGHKFYIKTEI